MEINGKEYEINTDITLKTEEMIVRMLKTEDNAKVLAYMKIILKDILLPTPTNEELLSMRRSQHDMIFEEFQKAMTMEDAESKKKRSIL